MPVLEAKGGPMTKQECLYCAIAFLIMTFICIGLGYLLMLDQFFFWAKITALMTGIFVLMNIYRIVQQEWIKNRRTN